MKINYETLKLNKKIKIKSRGKKFAKRDEWLIKRFLFLDVVKESARNVIVRER